MNNKWPRVSFPSIFFSFFAALFCFAGRKKYGIERGNVNSRQVACWWCAFVRDSLKVHFGFQIAFIVI